MNKAMEMLAKCDKYFKTDRDLWKAEWQSYSAKYFKLVADELNRQLNLNIKPKISFNPGGVAVIGDTVMTYRIDNKHYIVLETSGILRRVDYELNADGEVFSTVVGAIHDSIPAAILVKMKIETFATMIIEEFHLG